MHRKIPINPRGKHRKFWRIISETGESILNFHLKRILSVCPVSGRILIFWQFEILVKCPKKVWYFLLPILLANALQFQPSLLKNAHTLESLLVRHENSSAIVQGGKNVNIKFPIHKLKLLRASWEKKTFFSFDFPFCLRSQNKFIPGCSIVISRRLSFRVLYDINQFQNQFSRIWNRFKPVSSGFFEYFALKTSLKIGFIYLKPVYTIKYSKSRWSEMAQNVPTLERATLCSTLYGNSCQQ